MSRRKAVEQHEDKKPKHDWEDKVELSDIYVSYREQFWDMLTELYTTWDGNLGHMNIVKQRIDLTPEHSIDLLCTLPGGPRWPRHWESWDWQKPVSKGNLTFTEKNNRISSIRNKKGRIPMFFVLRTENWTLSLDETHTRYSKWTIELSTSGKR